MILKRKEKLEKLNGWTWDAREDLWIEGIKQLKKFHKKNNHISITNKFVDEDGFKLGQWVSTRRGRKKTLSDEKIKELEDFPDWTWDKNESSWKEGYQSLKSYTQQNGTADPPANFRDNNGYLVGGWVRRQRYNWEKLDPQKKELLNQLNGWKIRIK